MRAVGALGARLERVVGPALIDRVPRNHDQSDAGFRRRRITVLVTLIIGTIALGFGLAVKPGDSLFYLLTLVVALVWTVGGLLSGPLHLGYQERAAALRRPLLTPLLIGLAAAAIFLLGALVIREIGPLRDYVVRILEHAQKGNLALIAVVTVVNGIAEEVFFRGALFAAIGRRHPVVLSTLIYALATVATANPMLVFAALTLGAVLGLQRRASGGILASTITHVTWSMIMLVTLPPLLTH